MEKTWNIIFKQDGRVLSAPLKGTEEQARIYLQLNFDPEQCEVIEQNCINLKDMKFRSDDGENIEVTERGELIGSILYKDGKFFNVDEDTDEPMNELKLKSLKQFPEFKDLIECPWCAGDGYYMEQYCNNPASSCCGGCERAVQCKCETVKIYL